MQGETSCPRLHVISPGAPLQELLELGALAAFAGEAPRHGLKREGLQMKGFDPLV